MNTAPRNTPVAESGDGDTGAGSDSAAGDATAEDGDTTDGTGDDSGSSDSADPVCRTEVTEDEYGFEVEIEICDGESSSGGAAEVASFDSLDDFVGSTQARLLSRAFAERLVAQTGCAGESSYSGNTVAPADVRAAAESVPDDDAKSLVGNAFLAITEADALCNGDLAAWAEPTTNALASLQDLVLALGGEEDRVLLLDAASYESNPTLLTAHVMAVLDRLHPALTGVSAIQGSPVWVSSSHLLHERGLARLAGDGQQVDTVVVGDSLMARGLDPVALTEATGDFTVNLAMLGTTSTEQWELVDRALATQPNVSRIVWGENTHEFFRDCDNTTGTGRMEGASRLIDEAFAPVAALSEYTSAELLFGSPDTTYDGTGILRHGTGLHNEWIQGTAEPLTANVEQRRLDQIETWQSFYDRDDLATCDALVAAVAAKVQEWSDAGIDVVVVMMPTDAEGLSFHPAGAAGHAEAAAEVQAAVEGAGGRFADYTTEVDDEGAFADLAHLGPVGRDAFTSEMSSYLAG